jgi:periplasmic protein TonB
VRPQYTPEAMRQQIQGTVVLRGIVEPDGMLSDVSVVRSLDAQNGLDAEAIDAARKWKFAPGQLNGTPVPVVVQIEIRFNLR